MKIDYNHLRRHFDITAEKDILNEYYITDLNRTAGDESARIIKLTFEFSPGDSIGEIYEKRYKHFCKWWTNRDNKDYIKTWFKAKYND